MILCGEDRDRKGWRCRLYIDLCLGGIYIAMLPPCIAERFCILCSKQWR